MKGKVITDMNSIKRFKNLISIMLLYAQNIIVHDKIVLPAYKFEDTRKRITGRTFLKLPTTEKI